MESHEHPGKLHFEMSIQDRIPSVIRLESETHSPVPHTPPVESQEHPGKLHFEMSIQDRIPSVIRLESETHSPLPHTPTVRSCN